MSARGFVIVWVLYLLIAIGAMVLFSNVQENAELLGVLHAFNLAMGIYGIANAIDMGRRFGWKS